MKAQRVRMVGISGSLRRSSYSTGILHALAERVRDTVDLQVVTLENIPLYNEDLDIDLAVSSVAALKRRMIYSDGVVFSTPEYNHGLPGVLKNTLDWLSRPVFESCLKDKPVSIISSSKAFTGGVRAQYQLRETLISMQAHLVTGPEVVVGSVHHNFAGAAYTDEQGLTFIAQSLERLRTTILSRALLPA